MELGGRGRRGGFRHSSETRTKIEIASLRHRNGVLRHRTQLLGKRDFSQSLSQDIFGAKAVDNAANAVRDGRQRVVVGDADINIYFKSTSD